MYSLGVIIPSSGKYLTNFLASGLPIREVSEILTLVFNPVSN